MKNRASKLISIAVVGLCIALLIALTRGFDRGSFQSAARPIESPIKPEITTIPIGSPTPDIIAENQKLAATLSADATATAKAQPPTATPGAIAGPTQIVDELNRLELELPSGWHAVVPANAPGTLGETVIANFDFVTAEKAPADGITIHIGVGAIPDGNTFDDWVANRRKLEVSPDNGANGVVLTEPEPYKLGDLSGVSYYLKTKTGTVAKSIYLSLDGHEVLGISIYPLSAVEQLNTDAEFIAASVRLIRK